MMLSITDGGSLARALNSDLNPQLKGLLAKRQKQLGNEYPLDELAHFVLVGPADRLDELEEYLGFSVFQNVVDGYRFGEPDFTPSWEWIEDHGYCFELVFIMDDSGFGHVVIVEKMQGVDPELLSLCSTYAADPKQTARPAG
jgi:hypothetical protein